MRLHLRNHFLSWWCYLWNQQQNSGLLYAGWEQSAVFICGKSEWMQGVKRDEGRYSYRITKIIIINMQFLLWKDTMCKSWAYKQKWDNCSDKKARANIIEKLLAHEDMSLWDSGTSSEATIYRAVIKIKDWWLVQNLLKMQTVI